MCVAEFSAAHFFLLKKTRLKVDNNPIVHLLLPNQQLPLLWSLLPQTQFSKKKGLLLVDSAKLLKASREVHLTPGVWEKILIV